MEYWAGIGDRPPPLPVELRLVPDRRCPGCGRKRSARTADGQRLRCHRCGGLEFSEGTQLEVRPLEVRLLEP